MAITLVFGKAKVVGGALLLVAFFILLSQISYLWYATQDYSQVHDFSLHARSIGNWGGTLGAWLSRTSMYAGLGIGAFILPILLIIGGSGLIRGRRYSYKNYIMALWMAVCVDAFVGFFNVKGLGNLSAWNGIMGYELADLLYQVFGWTTPGVVLLLLAGIVLYHFNGVTAVQQAYAYVHGVTQTLQAFFQQWFAQIFSRKDQQMKTKKVVEFTSNGLARTRQTFLPNGTVFKPSTVSPPTTPVDSPADSIADSSAPTALKAPVDQEADISAEEYQRLYFQLEAPSLYFPELAAEAAKQVVTASPVDTFFAADAAAADAGAAVAVTATAAPAESPNSPTAPSIGEESIPQSSDSAVLSTVVADPTEIINEESIATFDVAAEETPYCFPPISILAQHQQSQPKVHNQELEEKKEKILQTLTNFKIEIDSIKATVGPTITLYELIPKAGVRISKIKSLEDDIALSLSALGIRIIAPMPGKGTVGIEVPNKDKELTDLRMAFANTTFEHTSADLPIVLGKDIYGEVRVEDLCKMPHVLIAGATGQGKSVGLNVMLASLLYKKAPDELKIILVDPKKVELSLYALIESHFLARLPENKEAIITDTKEVIHILRSLCEEMDMRYDLLKKAGCRNIKEYNTRFHAGKLTAKDHHFLPYIVLVIDELADLMMTAGKEIELPIARLAQLARAIGIHLIVATQRPSVNVITGTIKANFPARISYRVASQVDSRTILDTKGAEQLIGQGDMLFTMGSEMVRLQSPYVSIEEVEAICAHISEQVAHQNNYELPVVEDEEEAPKKVAVGKRDELFEDAARLVIAHQQGSVSLLQRKMEIGFNRAGRLMDQLEAANIVGGAKGSKPREVLVQDAGELESLLNNPS